MSLEVWRRDTVLVNGTWRHPAGGGVIEVENPATEQTIGTSASADAADVDEAVAAAATALGPWAARGVTERVAVLGHWLQLLQQQRSLLVETTIAEVGAPRVVAESTHVDTGLAVLEGYLSEATAVEWESNVRNSLVLREPIGVAACITPWNYPFYQVLAKIGGALVAGCTVVLKPAELTPLSAYLLADAAVEAGLPDGVLNLLPGSGAIVGEAMAAHPGVDMVSFTGSTVIGSRVSARAASTLKRVSLELGGKSSSVVLDDADLDLAVTTSVDAAMLNSGQTCSAWSRLLVPEHLLHSAVGMAAAAAEKLVVGDPTDTATTVGPVVSAAQRATITGFLERARADGATFVAGGPDHRSRHDRGHFISPTVVTDAGPTSEIATTEVFGPVLTVEPYRDEGEALRMANSTGYGLAGAVWSATRERSLAFARGMKTGQVDLNGGEFNPVAPFGGYGRSGNGRELGRWGIEEFLETKSVQQ